MAAPRERIELAGGHELVVSGALDRNVVELVAQNGQIRLSIEVSDAGAVLSFEGAALRLQAKGDLVIEAERLALVGRSAVALETAGDLHLRAHGDLTSEARIQTIRAELGNVNVKANDDVRLDGERVLVNCVDT